jgi:GxxExxY protein
MDNFPLKNETYEIIGVCLEVQRALGFGFSEVACKDAMEIEFITNNFFYQREDELLIVCKGKKFRHRFFTDFTCYGQFIVEVKSCAKGITDDHIAQVLNYLRVSGNNVGLIVNFGRRRLEYKRLILNNVVQ